MGHIITASLLSALQQPSRSPEEIELMREAIQGGPFGPYGPFGWPGVLNSVLVPLGFFAFVALIVWFLYRRSQTRVHARAEFHRQLLDKFTSGGEFAAFLNSSGGQRLLEGLWSEQVNAKERILKTMRGGVVLTVVGLGALALSVRNHALIIPGALVLALGAGFLISTAVTYRLSKKLGMLKDEGVAVEGTPNRV